MATLRQRLTTVYRRVDQLTGGSLTILQDAFQHFNEARASEAAASMAYYTLFSLFPLLLALVAAGSSFLKSERVYRELVTSVGEVIPVSQRLIESNIQQVLERRGTVGVVGVIGLLWSGMGVFTVLARHVNHAWHDAEPRNFLERRLVALGMVSVVAVFLFVSLLATPLLNLLPELQITLWNGMSIYDTAIWALLTNGVPWLFTLLLFLALYRWVPNTDVRWPEAVWAALLVSLVWELGERGFTWYLSSGLVQYRLVYGSLGAVVALMLWNYLSSWLVFFGAHLSAAIARHRVSE